MWFPGHTYQSASPALRVGYSLLTGALVADANHISFSARYNACACGHQVAAPVPDG